MKTVIVVLLVFALIVLSMFASAMFYSYALRTEFHNSTLFYVNPRTAILALFVFTIGIGLVFGAIVVSPLQNLGIIK